MTARHESSRGPAVTYVDPLGEPFLQTRFAPPARPATFLRRPRLAEHLDQALGTPLTMVNGSAGAGKTLLVADWADRLQRPVAWFTNEDGDQGCGMFWAYVLQALRAADVPLPDDLGCPADASRVDRKLLARLADELSGLPEPVLLVLDEFDRVPSARIAEQLEFVLHHAGQGLRLILVTRTEPLLPLHRYRAAGTMTEIRDAELALTPGEAAALLELHGLRLPEEAMGALVERTRGWAAGLRLCALAAQQSPDPEAYLKDFEAGRSTIADFLLAEVLKRQTARSQDVLLRVSVVERFCPELVAELTGRDDGEPVLAALHGQNAFVEDLGHTWYRLHPLFGEILRAHLRVRSPGLETELHRRAARWLRASGSLPQALAHGAAAGDWNFTARALVDDLAIGQLFTGLRASDLAELFSRMGPEATSAAADLVRAARDLSDRDIERGLVHLRRAEDLLASEPSDAAGRLSCVLLETLAARLTGSPGMAERAATTVERLRGEVPAELLEKHPEVVALLLTHLGSARLWAGHFDEARAVLSEAGGCPSGVSTALPREDAFGQLALIDHLDGWLGRAERKALAALNEGEKFGLRRPSPSGPGLAQLVLAALCVDRGELDQARAYLEEAAEAGAPPDPVTAAARSLATARLLLARGEPRAAAAAAEPATPAAVVSPWAEARTAVIVSAAHLAEGRPDSALKVLDDLACDGDPAYAAEIAWARCAAGDPDGAVALLDRTRLQGRTGPGVTVRAALVRASAAQRAGDDTTARKLLARALVEARRERLRRPFLEAGPDLRRLLDGPSLQGLAAGWLVPAAPAPHGGAARPAEPAPVVVEELSGREREVVGRLAEMMSTEEIAADLYVSVNTVKTHLKSVYRKLGVNGRAEAVRRARDHGLI
ncbi:LuxR C-terminal-related transcriptional regulator [Streptomyces sp900105245]|uniref:LuxR C-terminal-related transcriptional regulator n=1 Tax=Streptomyces sp. 900105245 TaxID=3154379 RepID=A0ABV1UAC3_9ACTN|nr:LuxR C-terminal-related transcriptional regulator [Streptomyces sp. CB01883]OKJ84744.1 LuxR family transcriptional regulator [Streptomyces sp. CB01883]